VNTLKNKTIYMIMEKQEQDFKQILRASYDTQKDADIRLRNLDYKLDKNLSTPESKVFIDKDRNPSIAIRGSKTVKDFLISDSLLLFGLEKYDPRQRRTNELVKKVAQKYKKEPTLYGHSLGGSLAEKTNSKGSIYTLNKGTGIGDVFKTIPKNQFDTRTSNDVVSLLSTTQRNKSKKKTLYNFQDPLTAHTITNLR
jgi:hypothetical protein